MFLLRRLAARSSPHQVTICRVPRPILNTTKCFLSAHNPVFFRSFHQTRVSRVEAGQQQKSVFVETAKGSTKGSENADDTIKAEPTEEGKSRDVREESVATDEVAGSTPKPTRSEAIELESTITDSRDTASEAAGAQRSRSLPNSSIERNPEPHTIIYVGNLFFEVTAQELEEEFSKFGEVLNSRIATDSRGLSKGFGFLEFASQEAADSAVRELDQRVFQGRRMSVQYHVPRQTYPTRVGSSGRPTIPSSPTRTLFIGNMSYQMSDRDLGDLFRELRDSVDIRVAIDRRSGQPRGFAHADFIDVSAAQLAKENLEKKVIYGRQLRVAFSTPIEELRGERAKQITRHYV